MSRRLATAGGVVLAGWCTAFGVSLHGAPPRAAVSPAVQAPARADGDASTRAVLNRYCVSCHNQRIRSGGIALDTLDADHPSQDAAVWERVIRKLRSRSMPPGGRPRPDDATYRRVSGALEEAIDRMALQTPNPGRTASVHRLNRTEYHNAIRDLLALDVDVASLLPAEDTSDAGFDNNGDVLSIAPAQLERYLSAAHHISRLAVGIAPPVPATEIYRSPLLLMQDDRTSEDLPFGSRGGIAVHHNFSVDADYTLKVRLRRNYNDYIMGMGRRHLLEIRVDGALVRRFSVGGEAKGKAAPAGFTGTTGAEGDPEWEEYMLNGADAHLEATVPVTAGAHLVTASFVRQWLEPEWMLLERKGANVLSNDEIYMGNASVDTLEISGPYRPTGAGDSESRRAIFVCRPGNAVSEASCAERILSRLARRAYRRPATPRDVATLMEFYRSGRESGETFDAGIQLAIERLLVDPDFLLRIERTPREPGMGPYRLGNFELASRLSFFLWNSVPDEALLAAAEQGRLTDVSVLKQQARRMLADSRAHSLVDNFAAQWLHLRKLEDWSADTQVFAEYDDNLRESFRRETELFIGSTLDEDRSVLDLLRADYTFVNERLARHYGIPGVHGTRFRRVTLPDTSVRGGLLGQGGLLALSSYPNRTSPVLRGKWLLDTIFGAPPPSPPPNVPALPATGDGGKPASVRERLEMHRKNPMCSSCHAIIDPLGFTLEHYDATGAWRTVGEGGQSVDATGQLANGATLDGLVGLRAYLLSEPEQFVSTLTEKLLAYALGRGLEYYDQPTVRHIVHDAASNDFRWSALIQGVVSSPAFLMRNRAGDDPATARDNSGGR